MERMGFLWIGGGGGGGGGGGEAWGEAVSAGVWVGSRRLLPFSSQMSMRSSSLVWVCCSTIVSKEFGLIGCARDKDLVWRIDCARGGGLVGVQVGDGFEGF